MTDDLNPEETPASPERPRGLFAQHPKLGILLIAALFYFILFSMCAFVLVIVFQGRT